MQAPLQARIDSDIVQTDTAKTAMQERRLVDNRPTALAQRKLAEMMNNSQRVLQQRALSAAIHNSPQMMAQRHKINALFDGAVRTEVDDAMPAELSPTQREEKPNNTGLPNQLKSGIESLSGMSMDHVKVHYNSAKPVQLQAHAYAQGNEIHLGVGQERHLPHEAWHVVQQARGLVRPTFQMKKGAINDNPSLEKEADMMGEKASQFVGDHDARNLEANGHVAGVGVVTQRIACFHHPVRPTIQENSNNVRPGEIAFETNESEKSNTASQMTLTIQRKLDFAHSGGTITRCVFTKRPGWTSAVTKEMPSTAGYDRGHLIPWMAVRLEIEFDMTKMNLQEAYDYLKTKNHTPDNMTWFDIEKAIKSYGRAENSDLDNLEYEDSSDNRSNGAKLPNAAALWQCAHEINEFEWDPPYEFDGKIITTKENAKKACLEVGVPDKSLWPTAKKRFGKGSNCVIQ